MQIGPALLACPAGNLTEGDHRVRASTSATSPNPNQVLTLTILLVVAEALLPRPNSLVVLQLFVFGIPRHSLHLLLYIYKSTLACSAGKLSRVEEQRAEL